MMTKPSISEQAERLSARRARMWPVLAVIFLSQQVIYFNGRVAGERTVDHVHVAAWLVLSIMILLVLVTGGGWIYPRKVRELANDEATRAHRDSAFRTGFIAAMVGCVALYVLNFYEPFGGTDAIHLIMTIGLAAALLRFGFLERRSMGDG